MLIVALLAFSLIRGIQAIITKATQKNFVNGFAESMYLTVVYAFVQFAFLWVMPPYYDMSFTKDILINPIFFAIFAMASFILYLSALGKGPTSLTNILNSFAMLIPVIVGLFLWKESISPFQVIGLVLVIIIIFLFNQSSYNEGEETKIITPKWMVLALTAAVFGGIAVIFTKQHALHFTNALKEYLILLNLFTILLGLPYVIYALIKKKIRLNLDKKFLMLVTAAAILQDIGNIIYTFYAGRLNSALFFPLMSILGIVSVVIASRVVLKEKASKKAYVGILLSLVAIYLLSV